MRLLKNINFLILVFVAGFFCVLYYDVLAGNSIFKNDTLIWYGAFYYYIDNIVKGVFPYWNPYVISGMHFYPLMSVHGMLDPTVMVTAFIWKLFNLSPLTVFVYYCLFRVVVFISGCYILYRHITRNTTASLIGASILLFSVTPAFFIQHGGIYQIYLTPYAMYFLLRFFEEDCRRKRYLFLMSLVVATGITLNFFIPSFYLFNLIVFILCVFALGIVNLRETVRSFKNMTFVAGAVLSVVLVGMMAAPPLAIMLRDGAANGELFPMQRIVQMNDGHFKKIMASDIDSNALSVKFVNEGASFNGYGNMLNLLYPDVLKSFSLIHKMEVMADIYQYIGILALAICIIGVLYGKNRYRYLSVIMLLVMFVNMFSFDGFGNTPYNAVQKMFNALFPFIKMTRVRQNLGAFFMMYLGMLLSIGLSVILDREYFRSLLKERLARLIAACLSVGALKLLITALVEHKFPYVSHYDLGLLILIAGFACLLFLAGRMKLPLSILYICIFAMLFGDIFYYNRYCMAKNFQNSVVMDRHPYVDFAEPAGANNEDNTFQLFRVPFAAPVYMAFQENISKVKGGISRGNNHTIFTTRRYYDLLTSIPMRNMFILNGLVYPILQFFPKEAAIEVNDKKELLDYFMSEAADMTDRLFIEKPGISPKPSQSLKPLHLYKDAEDLSLSNLINYYDRFVEQNGVYMQIIRDSADSYLHTNSFSIDIVGFNVNEVKLSVKNSIDGYLYYNDGWSRHWQVFDGSREIPLEIANYNYKAVFIPKGAHLLKFVFNPVHYKIGLVMFYCGLLFSLAIIVILRFSGKRTAHATGVIDKEHWNNITS